MPIEPYDSRVLSYEIDSFERLVQIHCKFPARSNSADFAFYTERVAIALAEGVLCYFQNEVQVSHLSFLPFGPWNLWNNEAMKHEMEERQERRHDQLQMIQSEPLLQADAFFDYTIHASMKDERPFMVIGKFVIKNSGMQDLLNPILCLRATPADGVKIQGQMVPPNMVKRMSVQGMNGSKGWKYLEENWFEKAVETGEYWIAPIQDMRIPLKQSEVLDFQITVLKQEPNEMVRIEAFVYFHEQNLRLPSNNRIAFSF